jgi:hypothetical protein
VLEHMAKVRRPEGPQAPANADQPPAGAKPLPTDQTAPRLPGAPAQPADAQTAPATAPAVAPAPQ